MVTIGIIIAHNELVEFEFEHREFGRIPIELRGRRKVKVRTRLWTPAMNAKKVATGIISPFDQSMVGAPESEGKG